MERFKSAYKNLAAMARLTIALVLALLAVYVVAETTYNIQLDGYQGTECAGTAIATTTYTNGSCGVFIGQYSSNVSCSATGASSGYLCISTTCGGDSCTFIDGSQRGFGEQLCQATGQQASVGFTCLETVVPEAPAAPAYVHHLNFEAIFKPLHSLQRHRESSSHFWHIEMHTHRIAHISPLSLRLVASPDILTAISLFLSVSYLSLSLLHRYSRHLGGCVISRQNPGCSLLFRCTSSISASRRPSLAPISPNPSHPLIYSLHVFSQY